LRQSVAHGAAKMRLEFMHFTETGNHPEIEDAAIARLQGFVAPDRAPGKFGQQLLKIAIKVVDIVHVAVDMSVAQNLAPHRYSTIVTCLVHDCPFLRSPAKCRPSPFWQSSAAAARHRAARSCLNRYNSR